MEHFLKPKGFISHIHLLKRAMKVSQREAKLGHWIIGATFIQSHKFSSERVPSLYSYFNFCSLYLKFVACYQQSSHFQFWTQAKIAVTKEQQSTENVFHWSLVRQNKARFIMEIRSILLLCKASAIVLLHTLAPLRLWCQWQIKTPTFKKRQHHDNHVLLQIQQLLQ